MAFPKNAVRAALVLLSFLLVVATFVLLTFKLDYGGMLISYWMINVPLFVAYALGIVWLGVEIFYLTDVLAARLKVAGVWSMLVCSLLSLILLIIRFERLKHISYWICLLPFYVGLAIAMILMVIGIYKTRMLVYDARTLSFHYMPLDGGYKDQ
jgi:hypothetical protein